MSERTKHKGQSKAFLYTSHDTKSPRTCFAQTVRSERDRQRSRRWVMGALENVERMASMNRYYCVKVAPSKMLVTVAARRHIGFLPKN